MPVLSPQEPHIPLRSVQSKVQSLSTQGGLVVFLLNLDFTQVGHREASGA